jgi:hypothetical protein
MHNPVDAWNGILLGSEFLQEIAEKTPRIRVWLCYLRAPLLNCLREFALKPPAEGKNET